MKKFKLLLLDANIVIEISRHRLWDPILARCEIHLARTVVGESQFYLDADDDEQPIDLTDYVNNQTITVFDLKPSDLATLRAQFDPVYFEKLDPGETESLGYLFRQTNECRICSADAIVFRVLGNLGRNDQGVSLEEVLNAVGLNRRLGWKFTKSFREQWTNKGFQEGLGGMGARSPL